MKNIEINKEINKAIDNKQTIEINEFNFINQILSFENISFRNLKYYLNISLTKDIDKNIMEIGNLINDLYNYIDIFQNAQKRLYILKELREYHKIEKLNIEIDFKRALNFKGINL